MCNSYTISIFNWNEDTDWNKDTHKQIKEIKVLGDIAKLIKEYDIQIKETIIPEDYNLCICGISLESLELIFGRIVRVETHNFKDVHVTIW